MTRPMPAQASASPPRPDAAGMEILQLPVRLDHRLRRHRHHHPEDVDGDADGDGRQGLRRHDHRQPRRVRTSTSQAAWSAWTTSRCLRRAGPMPRPMQSRHPRHRQGPVAVGSRGRQLHARRDLPPPAPSAPSPRDVDGDADRYGEQGLRRHDHRQPRRVELQLLTSGGVIGSDAVTVSPTSGTYASANAGTGSASPPRASR